MKHGRSAVRVSGGGGFEGTPDRLQRSVLKRVSQTQCSHSLYVPVVDNLSFAC